MLEKSGTFIYELPLSVFWWFLLLDLQISMSPESLFDFDFISRILSSCVAKYSAVAWVTTITFFISTTDVISVIVRKRRLCYVVSVERTLSNKTWVLVK